MGDKVRLLSDAIRLGATIHPQVFRSLFSHTRNVDEDGFCTDNAIRITGTCALGAVVVALNRAPETMRELILEDYYPDLWNRWPEIMGRMETCPDEGCGNRHSLISIVTHLNDRHQWTRERIADWLEGLGL